MRDRPDLCVDKKLVNCAINALDIYIFHGDDEAFDAVGGSYNGGVLIKKDYLNIKKYLISKHWVFNNWLKSKEWHYLRDMLSSFHSNFNHFVYSSLFFFFFFLCRTLYLVLIFIK